MIRNKILLLLLSLNCFATVINAKDTRPKIKEFVNHEIIIVDNFSGQSITLIKESKEYYIIRKYFGSGVPAIATKKYKAEFKSDYMISFGNVSEVRSDVSIPSRDEEFTLTVTDKGLDLYLNRLKVVIN